MCGAQIRALGSCRARARQQALAISPAAVARVVAAAPSPYQRRESARGQPGSVPVGFVVTAALVILGLAVSVRPPSRSGLLGLRAWLVSAIPNGSPFLAFYWMAGSTLLAYGQGGLRGPGVWAALCLAAAPLVAAPVLVRRSLRAAPALDQALGRPIPRRPPWIRVLFAPLPLFHPGVKRIGNLSYGNSGRRNRLDVYRPRHGGEAGPVLIHLHGGGFTCLPGRRSFYARRLLFRLARNGWICISATCRLQPAATFPDELIDVKKVVAWARAQATEYGGDPDRIVLVGSSFGARLATLAGFTVNDPRSSRASSCRLRRAARRPALVRLALLDPARGGHRRHRGIRRIGWSAGPHDGWRRPARGGMSAPSGT